MKKYLKVIGLVFLFLIVIIFNFFDKKEIEKVESVEENKVFLEENYVVEVKGEVNRPGLYIVSTNARVNDVINLALGFTEKADTSNINLASKVTDGMQIFVATKTNIENEGKVSVNTGTFKELDAVPNIGEATANKIINYREKNGPYEKLEDIKKAGISDAVYTKIKEYLCL